jgi:hypothetical protein
MKRLFILAASVFWLAGCAGTSTYVAAGYGYPQAYPYPDLYMPYPWPGPYLYAPYPFYSYTPRWHGFSSYRHRMRTPPHIRRPFPLREYHRSLRPHDVQRHPFEQRHFNNERHLGPKNEYRRGMLPRHERQREFGSRFEREGR